MLKERKHERDRQRDQVEEQIRKWRQKRPGWKAVKPMPWRGGIKPEDRPCGRRYCPPELDERRNGWVVRRLRREETS